MPRQKSQGPSQRQLKVSELVRKALAEVLLRREVDDPDLKQSMVTVTEVRVSPDLRNATVFVMPLGGQAENATIKALERHQRFLRGEVTRRVALKFTPALAFKLDESFDQSARVDALLRSAKVARDLG